MHNRKRDRNDGPVMIDAQQTELQNLIRYYFSDPERRIGLKAGQILMRTGQYNNRLYLVRRGRLAGYVEHDDGRREQLLVAETNSFIGVYSFFSHSLTSLMTIEALTDAELAYIDRQQNSIPIDGKNSLEQQFMPVVITELLNRQTRLQEISLERNRAWKKAIDNEKLAVLGQMASGIAHELNNAVSVLSRNTSWLVEYISRNWTDPMDAALFEAGLMEGRRLSSREVRRRKKELMEKFPLTEEAAEKLAQTGLKDNWLQKTDVENLQKDIERFFEIWDMGATFNDMLTAAEQSTHVVKSIRALGAQHKERTPGMDINESINNALALLRHKLKTITVNLDLNPLPAITGNMGEFVQVWTNLIKNALEAMLPESGRQPEITLISEYKNRHIFVIVQDNGPGIPKEIQPKIFQPNFTTKVTGLSFGLGLGLSIVERIVTEYNGTIAVNSSKSGTKFKLKIPVGDENE